jgi:enterochelin esterase-like enzyme
MVLSATSLLAAQSPQAVADPLRLGPTVNKTDDSPTGYTVTFRYQADSSVTLVQIYGEWSFSNPDTFATNGYVGEMRTGANWQAGDIVAGSGWNGGWPTVPMTLVDTTNLIWEYTTPLPSGTFSYRYSVCTGAGGTNCTDTVDPVNVPWSNQAAQVAAGSTQQTLSQVYVPQSTKYLTYDNSYQAPPALGNEGTLTPRSYPSAMTGGNRPITVWTPAGYDPTRETPYPTLYISHGGGGNETDWATQGVAQNIVANAIAAGKAQPMVIVMVTYGSLTSGNADASAILLGREMKDSLIPWVEANYNVSTKVEDRALSGLSQGGMGVTASFATVVDLVGYVGVWSPKNTPNAAVGGTALYDFTEEDNGAAIRSPLVIQVGVGQQDISTSGTGIGTFSPQLAEKFRALGGNVVENYMPGVHCWDVWRRLLNIFASDIIFSEVDVTMDPITSAKAWSVTEVSATVTPKGTSNTVPTGKVEFFLGSATGEKLGEATLDATGKATASVVITEGGAQQIVAVYSGDAYQSATAAEPLAVTVEEVDNPLRLGPTVNKTDASPTGYTVTFRYQADPGVALARIYGEWTFSNPNTFLANNFVGEMRMGKDWRSGDIVAGTGWNGGWPTVDMTLVDAKNRVWEYTTPLPSGTFSYRYSVCTGAGGTGCVNATDPYNLPWSNQAAQVAAGASQQTLSQVYVPQSTKYPSYDNSFQAPPTSANAGTLTSRSYPSALTGGTRHITVWTPAGYSPTRATPYPTLYISHGGGGNETDWATQGVAQNIVANAIAAGKAQPMVIVMVTYGSLTSGHADQSAILLGRELKDSLIPWMEANYNVSTKVEDRALAGLSQGGMAVTASFSTVVDLAGYIAVWSPKDDPNTAVGGTALYDLTEADNGAGIRSPIIIQVGAGLYDKRTQPATYPGPGVVGPQLAEKFRALGGNVVENYKSGVHSWDVWRSLLNDFASDIIFSAVEVTMNPVSNAKAWGLTEVSATVTPKGTSNAVPTGKVEFYLGSADGEKLGEAVLDSTGKATTSVVITEGGAQQIVAVYSGSSYASASSAEPLAVTVAEADSPATAQAKAEARAAAEAVVANAETINADAYTPASYAVLSAAVAAAKAAIANPASTAVQLRDAITAVKSAVAGLVLPAKAETPTKVNPTTKSVTVTGSAFKKNSKPKITVTIKLSDGSSSVKGRVAIFVGSKKVKVFNAIKTKTTITLPKKYAKAIKVKAKYNPIKADYGTLKYSAAKTIKVK